MKLNHLILIGDAVRKFTNLPETDIPDIVDALTALRGRGGRWTNQGVSRWRIQYTQHQNNRFRQGLKCTASQ